jgi:hypothetical protein
LRRLTAATAIAKAICKARNTRLFSSRARGETSFPLCKTLLRSACASADERRSADKPAGRETVFAPHGPSSIFRQASLSRAPSPPYPEPLARLAGPSRERKALLILSSRFVASRPTTSSHAFCSARSNSRRTAPDDAGVCTYAPIAASRLTLSHSLALLARPVSAKLS